TCRRAAPRDPSAWHPRGRAPPHGRPLPFFRPESSRARASHPPRRRPRNGEWVKVPSSFELLFDGDPLRRVQIRLFDPGTGSVGIGLRPPLHPPREGTAQVFLGRTPLHGCEVETLVVKRVDERVDGHGPLRRSLKLRRPLRKPIEILL